MKKILILSTLILATLSCVTKKEYTIRPKSGANTQGTADFTQKGKMVRMEINAYRLSPGVHAIHIHEKGDCSATDASSAGGHWNPTGSAHGRWNVNQFHMGDIGNLTADRNGTAQLVFETDKWCLGCKDATKNIIGKSIIIHEKNDDFKTQPTGNAGGRVGCIEIK